MPFLWRFHSVHHSIEQMDWVASGRLHPIDSAFTQAFTIMPLFLLGYGGGVFAGVAVFITLLALFQHANVRLRFPVLRWVINTPEWHHWHHAIDDEARDKNFGLPVIDKIFGTAYMPKGKPTLAGFGTHSPVPADRLPPAPRLPLHPCVPRGVPAGADTGGVRYLEPPDPLEPGAGPELICSATDLVSFAACPHLTRLELAAARGELERPERVDPFGDLLIRRGSVHESDVLATYPAADVVLVAPDSQPPASRPRRPRRRPRCAPACG